jgi:2-keto-4-pentenoate hydratase/2-oxohepta-3-ene-1,7-dioic acid hydratase in catechol pathway
MRWARFECDGTISYGIVEDDAVEIVEGDPFNGHRRTGTRQPFDAITWLPPVIPPTFYCVGLNYAEHLRMSAARRGQEPVFPSQPDVGYRAVNALIGHGAAIVVPPDASERVQYEGELVCVVGRKCKNLTRDNALDCLLGFTIGNDVSERAWQKTDAARTRVRLNGRQVIEFATNNMLFGVVDYLVAITRYITLFPGDVLWMGTEGEAENLRSGDQVEIEITGIGTLRNPVIAA